MTAVIEMSTIPQWKHNFLGSKTHSDEKVDRMQPSVSVPEWKREILLRKNKNLDTNYSPEIYGSSSSNGSTSKSVSLPRTNVRTSSGSDVFPYDDNYLESCDNGPLNNSRRVIADHLESVHDNPFFRAKGRTFVHRSEKDFGNDNCIEKNDENNIDDLQEYSPFSGYVNKLRKKFSILGADSAPLKLDKSNRSASLENLLDTHHCHRHEVRFFSNENDESELNTKEKRLTKLSVFPSTSSTDCSNYVSGLHRPADDRQLWCRRDSDVEHRHNYVAPDLKIGRDKLEIIDLPPLPKQKKNESVFRNETKTSKDKSGEENELPKPNTVSNFRSMFETTQSNFHVDKNVANSQSLVTSPRVVTALSQNDVFTTNAFTSSRNSVNEYSVNPETLSSKSSVSEFEKTTDDSFQTTTEKLTNFSEDDGDQRLSDEEWTHSTEVIYFRQTSSDDKHSESVASDSHLFNGETKHQSNSEQSHTHAEDNNNIRPFSELRSNFESSLARPQEDKEEYFNSNHRGHYASSHSATPTHSHRAESSGEHERKLLFDSNAISAPTVEKKFDSRFVDRPTSQSAKNKKKFDSHSVTARSQPPLTYSSLKSETSKSDITSVSLDKKSPVVPKERLQVSETDQQEKSLFMKNRHVFSANINPQYSGLEKKSIQSDYPKQSSKLEIANKSKNTATASNLKIESVKGEKLPPGVHRKKVFDSSFIKPVVDNPPKTVSNTSVTSNNMKSTVVNGTVETMSTSFYEGKHSSGDEKSNDSVSVQKQEPVKGIPSILAQRSNKSSSKSGLYVSKEHSRELETSNETEGSEGNSLVRPSDLKNRMINGSLSSTVIKNKPRASSEKPPKNSNATLLVLAGEKTDKRIPQSNIDDIIGVKKKEVKAKEIFSSDSIIPVVKKAPSRKNLKRPSDVQLLILPPDQEESPGYIPTKIKPCPYVFIGAPVLLPSQPLQKTKIKKLTISFNDTATSTFEYVAEKTALEDYLTEHPEEREELLKLEALEAADTRESSDDLEDTSKKDVGPLKSTPLLANPGGDLVSYKSKMQVDFQFGMSMEPESEKNTESEPISEAEDMHIRPADDDDLSNWSETKSSDMLF